MNIKNSSIIRSVFAATLLGALAGCVGYADGPRGEVYVQPPPVRVEPVMVQDDYVYYPDYQVYYSSNRRQYVYQEGRDWVTRPAPRGVSIGVLSASPSVRLAFHDRPSLHHEAIVRQYPKHETARGHDGKEGGNERN